MMLWVLEDNPSCGFYGAMGGMVADEKWEEIGGKKLKELAYGWSSLETVVNQHIQNGP